MADDVKFIKTTKKANKLVGKQISAGFLMLNFFHYFLTLF